MWSLCLKPSVALYLTYSKILSLYHNVQGSILFLPHYDCELLLSLSHLSVQSCWPPCFSITPSTLTFQGLCVCNFSLYNVLPLRYLHGLSPYSLLVSAHISEGLSRTILKQNHPNHHYWSTFNFLHSNYIWSIGLLSPPTRMKAP